MGLFIWVTWKTWKDLSGTVLQQPIAKSDEIIIVK